MEIFSENIVMSCDLVARKAANFVFSMSNLPFSIWITKGNKRINAKSLIGVLSLMVRRGEEVCITVDKSKQNLEIVKKEIL